MRLVKNGRVQTNPSSPGMGASVYEYIGDEKIVMINHTDRSTCDSESRIDD
jgi:hypothetical protein